MTEENKVQALPHNLIMENRNRLTVSGVYFSAISAMP